MEKIKVTHEDMEFEALKEEWCDYRLSDGTVIKIKLIATEVRKVIGEHDEMGRPIYQFKFQTVNRIIHTKPKNPEELVS